MIYNLRFRGCRKGELALRTVSLYIEADNPATAVRKVFALYDSIAGGVPAIRVISVPDDTPLSFNDSSADWDTDNRRAPVVGTDVSDLVRLQRTESKPVLGEFPPGILQTVDGVQLVPGEQWALVSNRSDQATIDEAPEPVPESQRDTRIEIHPGVKPEVAAQLAGRYPGLKPADEHVFAEVAEPEPALITCAHCGIQYPRGLYTSCPTDHTKVAQDASRTEVVDSRTDPRSNPDWDTQTRKYEGITHERSFGFLDWKGVALAVVLLLGGGFGWLWSKWREPPKVLLPVPASTLDARTRAAREKVKRDLEYVASHPEAVREEITSRMVNEEAALADHREAITKCQKEHRIPVMGFNYDVICLEAQDVAWAHHSNNAP